MRRGAYRVLVAKPEGRKPLGRARRRRDDNNKTDIQEVGRGTRIGMTWFRTRRGGGLF
jgi:hypothetical protein